MLLKVENWDVVKSSQDYYLLFKFLKNNCAIIFDNSFNTIKHEKNINSITFSNKKENIIRYIELRIEIWNYLKKENLLTYELTKILKINIFDSIRILYQENKEAGRSLYSKYVHSTFSPINSNSTNFMYIVFYKIFGFNVTQKIWSLVK